MQARQGSKSTTPNAALPGFPGASHLYHVGATGFFLDHPQHISLTTAQQTALNGIKEKSALDQATAARRVEDLEQELWTLTSAAAPDATKIDAAVRAIETLRGNQRLAFIRAVGEAAKVLTPDQQAALLGTKPMTRVAPAAAPRQAAPAAAPMAPMKME
ncbi:periplasmic heavy metal sensor [Schlegelella sp. ID0723]|uniref:Periplasmic heavy metal sensor n=2 Tax=Piscinibacter koreensis TaxID=2742824 RepID=A0A7Y6NSG9_9BURK|nr:periplasmic heavy metal sensor [Schlegelella koreensis]